MLSGTVGFGFYMGVVLAQDGQCAWTVFKMTQLLALVCLGAGLLFLGVIIWVIIVYVIFKDNRLHKTFKSK